MSSSGTFKLTLQFSEDYPNKPPTVRFVSRMFHPNSKSESELSGLVFTIQLIITLATIFYRVFPCDFHQFTQMEASVWIFYKTSGVLYMMLLLYLHLYRYWWCNLWITPAILNTNFACITKSSRLSTNFKHYFFFLVSLSLHAWA